MYTAFDIEVLYPSYSMYTKFKDKKITSPLISEVKVM